MNRDILLLILFILLGIASFLLIYTIFRIYHNGKEFFAVHPEGIITGGNYYDENKNYLGNVDTGWKK